MRDVKFQVGMSLTALGLVWLIVATIPVWAPAAGKVLAERTLPGIQPGKAKPPAAP